MTRCLIASLLLPMVIMVAGCQPGDGGPFVPLRQDQIEIGTTGRGDPLARIHAQPLSVEISGQWMGQGEQTIDVRYMNTGPIAVDLNGFSFELARQRESAELLTLLDMTGIDLADGRDDNDEPVVLYDADNPSAIGTITIAPRETRRFQANFANMQAGEPMGADQEMTFRLPSATTIIAVRFKAARW